MLPTEQPKPQADKFREIARELECDEDEAAFEEKVRGMDFQRKVATTPKPVAAIRMAERPF